MMREKTSRRRALIFALLASMGLFSNFASAQMLEDIEIREEKDEVAITIQLTSPVLYKRHAPVRQGQTLDIYYQLIPGTSPSVIEENETRFSPSLDLISDFSVASKIENGEPELVIQFDREVKYRVQAGKDNRSFLIYVKKSSIGKVERAQPAGQDLPMIKPEASDDQNTKQAEGLVTEGRNALQVGNFPAAIEAFNKLLQLPSNKYTPDAQEWVGVAREGVGQTDKARLEYESYLKLYSTHAGVARVKRRLAGLPVAAVAGAPVEEKKAAKSEMSGNFGMHFYHGASATDTSTTNAITNSLTQSTLTDVEQSSLIAAISLDERFRSDEYDNRLSFNNSFTKNYLSDPSRNKLSSAYFEVKNKVVGYSTKLGRQSSANGTGVSGKFDGISGGYSLSSKLRANAVVGRLADTSYPPITQPTFYGASLDVLGASGGGLSGSVYVINQALEGIADRRALGAELRYFGIGKTAFALLDYDTTYAALNTLLLQGSLDSDSGTTYNFMLDRRSSPFLSIRNATINTSGAIPTLQELLQKMSLAEMQKLAKDRTAIDTQAQIGVTRPMGDKWQVAGDIMFINNSSVPNSGTPDNVDGTFGGIEGYNSNPGGGKQWTFEGKLIGSNVYSSNDIDVISLGRITGASINAQSFFLSSRTTVSRWTYEAALRMYRQDNFGIKETRTTPSLKVTYQVRKKINLEMEGSLEAKNTSGQGSTSNRTLKFYSLGFRWEFD